MESIARTYKLTGISKPYFLPSFDILATRKFMPTGFDLMYLVFLSSVNFWSCLGHDNRQVHF